MILQFRSTERDRWSRLKFPSSPHPPLCKHPLCAHTEGDDKGGRMSQKKGAWANEGGVGVPLIEVPIHTPLTPSAGGDAAGPSPSPSTSGSARGSAAWAAPSVPKGTAGLSLRPFTPPPYSLFSPFPYPYFFCNVSNHVPQNSLIFQNLKFAEP